MTRLDSITLQALSGGFLAAKGWMVEFDPSNLDWIRGSMDVRLRNDHDIRFSIVVRGMPPDVDVANDLRAYFRSAFDFALSDSHPHRAVVVPDCEASRAALGDVAGRDGSAPFTTVLVGFTGGYDFDEIPGSAGELLNRRALSHRPHSADLTDWFVDVAERTQTFLRSLDGPARRHKSAEGALLLGDLTKRWSHLFSLHGLDITEPAVDRSVRPFEMYADDVATYELCRRVPDWWVLSDGDVLRGTDVLAGAALVHVAWMATWLDSYTDVAKYTQNAVSHLLDHADAQTPDGTTLGDVLKAASWAVAGRPLSELDDFGRRDLLEVEA